MTAGTSTPRFSLSDAERIARELFAVDAPASALSSERDQNFRVGAAGGAAFILKIANAEESREALAGQNALLAHLAARAPDLPVPRVMAAADGSSMPMVEGEGGRMHPVRLFTCLPGETAASRPRGAAFRRQVGRLAARLDRGLADFEWRVPDQGLIWDLRHTAKLRPLLEHFARREERLLAERALALFGEVVVPRLDRLPRQAIHNDLNGSNLLVEPDRPDAVAGIIDFGDAVHSARVFELAVAAAHQTFGQSDPISAIADVVGGYKESMALTDDEAASLPVLVLARLAVRMGVIAGRRKTHPGSTHFDASVEASIWRTIGILSQGDPATLAVRFQEQQDNSGAPS